MTDDLSDITPATHFLESIRADRGFYWALLAEGIDNGFDAGATEIVLTLGRDVVGLHDNGSGITRERELAIVRLGEHRPMPTTALGMFGIGLKYHAMSAGDVLDVESVSTDGRMTLNADWAAVVRSGRWSIPRPKWMPTLHAGKTGTHIKIRSLRWPTPTPKDERVAREKLAQLFYPALVERRTIVLNDKPLPILREPEMTHVVEGDVRLPSGKGAHVRGGIIDPASALYQVHVSYRHRVIQSQSGFGCGGYTGLRRMFARVQLTGPWTLARFKNDLADNEADELRAQVEDILRPVLEECHSAAMTVQIDEMTALLNAMLPPELTPARPPKRQETTTARRKKGGRPHGITKDGDERPQAPARKPRTHQELVISFDPVCDEYGYGHFIPGKPDRIVLASDNPHIASLMEIRDKAVGARSIYSYAIAIYLKERSDLPGQHSFPNFDGSFGLQLWQMTKQQKVNDESAVA